MGRRGPPKKPTEQKLLQCIPGGKHKLNKNEPLPPKTKNARPPKGLGKVARKIWKSTVLKLEAMKVLTDADLACLERYCHLAAQWHKVAEFIEKNGYFYPIFYEQTPEQIKKKVEPKLKYRAQYPEVNLYMQIAKELTRIECQFGMTPAARASVGVANPSSGKGTLKEFLYGSE